MRKSNPQSEFLTVHWFTKEEWKKVYLLIFGPESDDKSKKEALQLLFVWKMRNPYIPSGIESTLGLLEVDLQIPNGSSDSAVPERLLRLMYSSVIMRFINHTLDDAQSKKATLFQAAEQLDIPQWIINLRHETAHGHELPSLDVLRKAAHFSMNWLHEAYWKPKFGQISDFYNNKSDNTFKEKIFDLLHMHNSLVTLQYPAFDISKFCDIPDKDVKTSLLSSLRTILKDNVNNKSVFNKTHSLLMEIIEKYLNENASVDNHRILCDILVDSESLFMTGNIVNYEKNSFKALDENCLQLWKPFLRLLHTQNIIAILLSKLIDVTNDTSSSVKQKKAAAQWIKEIAFGLNKSTLIKRFALNLSFEDKKTANDHLYKILVQNYPNHKNGLTFDLLQPVPSELTSLDFIQDIFANSNSYLQTYAQEIIELAEPKLPIHTRHKLINLVNIMMCNNSQDISHSQIYTVDDIKNSTEPNIYRNSTEYNDVTMEESQAPQSVWQKSSAKYNWGSCPIGLLPWQDPIAINLF